MATQLTQISEETRDELAALMLQLSQNKKTREPLLRSIKEIRPDTVIPEQEAKELVETRTSAIEKKFDEFLEAQKKEKFETSLAEKKKKIVDQYQYSDDDVKKIEELMVNRQVLNYEDAAKLYEMERKPDEPTNYGSSGYGPAAMPNEAELLENPDRFSLSLAHQMIDEMNRSRNQRKF